MPDEPDELTLMQYLNGDCAPEVRATVEAWMARDTAHRALLEKLRAAWNPPPIPEFDPEDRLRRRLQRGIARARSPHAGLSHPGFRWAGIAAAMVAAAAGVVLVARAPAPPAVAPAPTRDVVTPRGQRAAFNLADGTRVILDADSRLREVSKRELSLVGRAFFQVVHDSTLPFRVHTATGVIEDLGTEFVVAAFPEQRATRVVVASGTVAVRATSTRPTDAPLATVGRGGMAWIDSSGLARMSEQVDVASQLAWTEGRHVFRRAPLGEVLAELGRWYDVELRVSDPALEQRRLTATFGNEALPQVLEVLSVSLGVRAERQSRVVTLVPAAPSSSHLHPVEH